MQYKSIWESDLVFQVLNCTYLLEYFCIKVTVLAQIKINKIIAEGSRPNKSTISGTFNCCDFYFFWINFQTPYFARVEMMKGRGDSTV